mmetsp:Transcript_47030/g.109948  ORF Transcript_47030/g.109948 Transcript_47030/m.109948 type:complete len:311 (-) Transcript_47030:120-1052(-)
MTALQRGRSSWLDALDEDNDLLETLPQVGANVLLRRVTVAQCLELFLCELFVPCLFGKLADLVLCSVVAAVPLQRLSSREGLAACGASTAVPVADLAVRLPLPGPRPSPDAEVFLEASTTLTRFRRALKHVGEVSTARGPQSFGVRSSLWLSRPAGKGNASFAALPGPAEPLRDSKRSRHGSGPFPQHLRLAWLLAARSMGRQRTPGIDPVDHNTRHRKQQCGPKLVVRLQQSHLCGLKTSDVTLLHAVAADVRLHQRMLRPQVAYSEHEVVCSIDASNDCLVTAENGASPRLRPCNSLEDDANEQGAND